MPINYSRVRLEEKSSSPYLLSVVRRLDPLLARSALSVVVARRVGAASGTEKSMVLAAAWNPTIVTGNQRCHALHQHCSNVTRSAFANGHRLNPDHQR